jgi:hypothetical protein
MADYLVDLRAMQMVKRMVERMGEKMVEQLVVKMDEKLAASKVWWKVVP